MHRAAHFHSVLDAMPWPVWHARSDGSAQFHNRAWLVFAGMSPDEARGWGWVDVLHPECKAPFLGYWEACRKGDAAGEFEVQMRKGDGTYRRALLRMAPVQNGDAGTMEWYLSSTDIEERRQLEHLLQGDVERARAREQLRRIEAHLGKVQSLSSTGSFFWNVAADQMTWSDETYRICEVDRSIKPTGVLARDLFHPDDLHYFREMISGTARDYNFECRLRRPSGIKHIQVVGVAERDEAGQLREWTGTFMDITERKRTAEALRASEHYARGQVEALSQTLTLMSTESAPEKLLDHVLRMACLQLSAHSLGVWEMNEVHGYLEQVANCDGEQVHQPTLEEMATAPRMEIPAGDHPIWTAFFRDGQRVVIGDLRYVPLRVRFADDPGADWHCWLSHVAVDPEMMAMQQALEAAGIVATLCIPMLVAGKVKALISMRFSEMRDFEEGELKLAHALAHQAALAMQIGRLSLQSKDAAVIEERNRLARDIHDTLAQGLSGIIIQLRAAKDAWAHGLSTEADSHYQRAVELANRSLHEARRSVRALRPQALEDGDLVQALEEMFARMTADTRTKATLTVQGRPLRLSAQREENLLRVSQEILTNAVKHADATQFLALIDYQSDLLKMEFRDNGRGFDPRGPSDGFGLMGIKERVEKMGGALHLSSAPMRGTVVALTLPAASPLKPLKA